jgi:hypothetical protein
MSGMRNPIRSTECWNLRTYFRQNGWRNCYPKNSTLTNDWMSLPTNSIVMKRNSTYQRRRKNYGFPH